jgi:polysaccharide export outer membrane protein
MTNFFKYLLGLFAAAMILGSCIPNKRLVYLQDKNEPKRGTVRNTDTIFRNYETRYIEYVLKPNDIVTIRIASITPAEFDFVQKYEEQLGLIRKLSQYDQANVAGGQGMRTSGGQGDGGMSSIALDRQQTGFELDAEGYLELPYIGKLKLSGFTLTETEAQIKEKLKGYFETPVVRVQLLNFHFTILGEVNNEGRYTLFDPNGNIIDAIAIAGNLNDFADRSKIKVVRFEGAKATVFYVNILKEDLLGQSGFFLKPNDLIIVPPLQARASRKYTLPTYTTAVSLISSTLTFVLFLISINSN